MSKTMFDIMIAFGVLMCSLRIGLWAVRTPRGSRAVRRLGKILGGPFARMAWDAEAAENPTRWDGPRSPTLVALIEKYANGGLVAEYGCGSGALSRCVDPERYGHWIGYDISMEMVRAAYWNRRRPAHAEYMVAAMSWKNVRGSDVTLSVVEDALHLLGCFARRRFLRAALRASDHVIVAVHDAKKHAATLRDCEYCGEVVERVGGEGRVVVVLRGTR